MMRRLIVSEEDAHTVLQQEAPQDPLVFHLSSPVSEAGAQFTDHDERQQDRLSLFHYRHRLDDA